MFRFRDPNDPPRGTARRYAGACARGALLGAAAAAKASADALKWAAERQPAPPVKADLPQPVFVSPSPPVMARPVAAARPAKSSSHVLPVLAVVLAVGVAVAVSGMKSEVRVGSAPPAPQNMGRMAPNKLADYTADNGVIGGAKAALAVLEKQAKANLTEPPAPPVPPVPPVPPRNDQMMAAAVGLAPELAAARPRTAVRLAGVKSGAPHTRKEAAVEDAVQAAREKLAEAFAKLDPPLDAVPTAAQVRGFVSAEAEVRPTDEDRADWQKAGLDPNRVWATVDVEVSEDQVRQIRGDRRLGTAGPLFALPAVLALAVYGFLRLDAWSRGHLTGWLGAGLGGLVLAAAAIVLYAARGGW